MAPSTSRRAFLSSASTTLMGLSWGGLLRAQAHAEKQAPAPHRARINACIFIFQYGGPSHLDTFDMKPDAPITVRGEFKPIGTSVPGLAVCEHLPHLSQVMHKVSLIRSMHHQNRLHDSASIEVLTGYPSPLGDREIFSPVSQFYPSFGGTLSHLWEHKQLDVAHAALPWVFHNVIDVPCQGGGFLGRKFDPFQVIADPASISYRAKMLERPDDLPFSRIEERLELLRDFETKFDLARISDQAKQWEQLHQRAVGLLSARKLRDALDIERENQRTRERYGLYDLPTTGGGVGAANAAGQNMRGQNLLLARRLVEAGVPFVNVYDYKQQGQNWDAHADNFGQHKKFLLPAADRGLAALIQDLDERGLLDTTLVVVTGEFGRTPQINPNGGRDHWPDCYSVLLAGGGCQGGFVHGSSDRIGAYPAESPVTPADLAATIFWRFGIPPETEIHDTLDRPHRVASGQPIREVFA